MPIGPSGRSARRTNCNLDGTTSQVWKPNGRRRCRIDDEHSRSAARRARANGAAAGSPVGNRGVRGLGSPVFQGPARGGPPVAVRHFPPAPRARQRPRWLRQIRRVAGPAPRDPPELVQIPPSRQHCRNGGSTNGDRPLAARQGDPNPPAKRQHEGQRHRRFQRRGPVSGGGQRTGWRALITGPCCARARALAATPESAPDHQRGSLSLVGSCSRSAGLRGGPSLAQRDLLVQGRGARRSSSPGRAERAWRPWALHDPAPDVANHTPRQFHHPHACSDPPETR